MSIKYTLEDKLKDARKQIETQEKVIADRGETIVSLNKALDKAEDEAIKMEKKLYAYEKRDKKQEEMIEHLQKVRNSLMKKLAECEPEQDRYDMAKKAKEEERRKMMIAAEISQEKARMQMRKGSPHPLSPRSKRFYEALQQARKRNKDKDKEFEERMRRDAEIARMKASGNFEKYKANVKF